MTLTLEQAMSLLRSPSKQNIHHTKRCRKDKPRNPDAPRCTIFRKLGRLAIDPCMTTIPSLVNVFYQHLITGADDHVPLFHFDILIGDVQLEVSPTKAPVEEHLARRR